MERITIDVVSDVVCPWCYLGKARLELAIAEVQDEIGVDTNWRPYRLNPDYPKEGVDQKKALAEKLGGEERVAQAHKMLTDLGREVGIAFNFEAIKIGPNTLDAHRLIHWAMIEGREAQDKIVAALFTANFEEGRNVGDHAVLLDIAEKAGLDRSVIASLLASDADRDLIVAEIKAAQEMGVNGVPFFIFDQQYAVSGAQTPDVLAGALRDIAKAKAEARSGLN
ncbi:DSBA-like thioredoxin protein [Rhizobium phaseoli]|uniref:DSBA-like thioredoxin protein n=2 Tax=Rhizobium TaxID=379 RepID=A0A192TAJ0_9HYPH|nr:MULTISPECIES: DsbA family protein [Rhizobium]ACE91107.1 putative dithiol-disulfide isomerase protein (involved in polyketide biosynthesis) [Rhizobium etli CIAT 652]MDH6648129.1 putative DsbA family dithiol-disulfide isomerase [Rhizobium esperanzae]ANL27938.1 DSBA-like thioredoxin protein [Rhizobium phaseoli]ANL40557.1 DSBA-like thioredoxin protein [Rhizobium phaseoli]ANL53292.1 DSBA-like thioredoxin protein [Rhizobium phaseoli]